MGFGQGARKSEVKAPLHVYGPVACKDRREETGPTHSPAHCPKLAVKSMLARRNLAGLGVEWLMERRVPFLFITDSSDFALQPPNQCVKSAVRIRHTVIGELRFEFRDAAFKEYTVRWGFRRGRGRGVPRGGGRVKSTPSRARLRSGNPGLAGAAARGGYE